jgi:predicted amidophosphoribosyltransferase
VPLPRPLRDARDALRRCALPLAPSATVCGSCLREPPPFDAALAAVDYAAPWDRLVTAFKFHDAIDLRGRSRARSRRRAGARRAAASLVVPVPLAPTRLRTRGYNQAWEIARRVARMLGIDADASLVLRLRETVHQLALPPLARAGNVAVRSRSSRDGEASSRPHGRDRRRRHDDREHRGRGRARPEASRREPGRGLGAGANAASRRRLNACSASSSSNPRSRRTRATSSVSPPTPAASSISSSRSASR